MCVAVTKTSCGLDPERFHGHICAVRDRVRRDGGEHDHRESLIEPAHALGCDQVSRRSNGIHISDAAVGLDDVQRVEGDVAEEGGDATQCVWVVDMGL